MSRAVCRRSFISALGIIALLSSAVLVGSPASAAIPTQDFLVGMTTAVDHECVSAVSVQAPQVDSAKRIAFCTVTTKTYAVATARSLPVATSALASRPLRSVIPAASVTKTFSQTATSGLSLWQETHRGSFSFDGNTATPGWHSCGYGYRFAYDISNIRCSFTKPNSLNIIAHDDYRVSALISGSPVSWEHSMSVVLTFDGMILPYTNT
jgi:hypothetical protein